MVRARVEGAGRPASDNHVPPDFIPLLVKRLCRFVLVVLMLNLTLSGMERACDHEQPVAAAAGGPHTHTPEHAPVPPQEEQAPCEDAAQCCDAMASCAVSSVAARETAQTLTAFFATKFLEVSDREPASNAAEIATPPPKLG